MGALAATAIFTAALMKGVDVATPAVVNKAKQATPSGFRDSQAARALHN